MISNKSMFVSTQKNNALIRNRNIKATNNCCSDTMPPYHLLAKQMEIINIFLLEYSLGNYQNVVNMFTRDKNYKLAVALKLFAVNPLLYPDYETIRKTANYALQGINQVILQHLTLKDTQEKLLVALEVESILYNMTKLQKYIDKLKTSHNSLPDVNISIVKAIVSPEILAYINQYGYPSGGVFDTDKMAIILLNGTS